MHRKLRTLPAAATALLALGLALSASAGTRPPDNLDDLVWLAGTWAGTSADGARTVEHWMASDGNVMLGINRTVKDRHATWEYLRIEARKAGTTLIAAPSGQPSTEFRLARQAPGLVEFTNPAHDFPKRIRYELKGDALHVLADDGAGNKALRWTWRRQPACPGGTR